MKNVNNKDLTPILPILVPIFYNGRSRSSKLGTVPSIPPSVQSLFLSILDNAGGFFNTPAVPIILAFFLLILSPIQLVGGWARQATDLCCPNKVKLVAIESPDKSTMIFLYDECIRIAKEKIEIQMVGCVRPCVCPAELLWASDSKAFCITESLGGLVGEWVVNVYQIAHSKVEKFDISKEAIKDFMKSYKCNESEEPEVGGIRWINGSSQLLLALEVPNHSSCPKMGKVMGYIIEVPSGKILEKFNEKELKAKWGDALGDRFDHQE